MSQAKVITTYTLYDDGTAMGSTKDPNLIKAVREYVSKTKDNDDYIHELSDGILFSIPAEFVDIIPAIEDELMDIEK